MEYIESASQNTFYPFQNKNQKKPSCNWLMIDSNHELKQFKTTHLVYWKFLTHEIVCWHHQLIQCDQIWRNYKRLWQFSYAIWQIFIGQIFENVIWSPLQLSGVSSNIFATQNNDGSHYFKVTTIGDSARRLKLEMTRGTYFKEAIKFFRRKNQISRPLSFPGFERRSKKFLAPFLVV